MAVSQMKTLKAQMSWDPTVCCCRFRKPLV